MHKFIVIEKKKHIMLISSWYPSRIDPYNGDFVQRHAIAISKLNKVSVVHVEGDENIKKWELETNQTNNNLIEYIYYFPKSKLPFLNFIRKIQGLMRGRKQIGNIDLIHGNVVHYHFIWLLVQSLPYIISEHATQFHRLDTLPNAWLKKMVYKPIYRNAKRILPVSRHLGNKLEELFGKLPIRVVPNVIDTDLFYPLNSKNSIFTFLHISNLSEAKNIFGILKAIYILNENGIKFKFQIGGNGSLDTIENFRVKNGLEDVIEILPALTHIQVAKYMQNADCFILFSHFENQPCVLAEALATGLPFISSDVGGVQEFMPDCGSWLVEPSDLNHLVQTMAKALTESSTIDKQVLSNYAKQTFSNETVSQKINKIYNDC